MVEQVAVQGVGAALKDDRLLLVATRVQRGVGERDLAILVEDQVVRVRARVVLLDDGTAGGQARPRELKLQLRGADLALGGEQAPGRAARPGRSVTGAGRSPTRGALAAALLPVLAVVVLAPVLGGDLSLRVPGGTGRRRESGRAGDCENDEGGGGAAHQSIKAEERGSASAPGMIGPASTPSQLSSSVQYME